MGRGKIEIKRIENSSNRQVSCSKRRNGIIKKAKEIAVLCDAKVSLIIFTSSGKMHEHCSPSTNLADMFEQYQKIYMKRLWDAKHENLGNEIDRIKKENDNMQIELMHLKGEDISSLNCRDLMVKEDALETGLVHIREKQMEYCMTMKRNQQQEIVIAKNAREVENGFHQTMRDYNAHQLYFSFRVQPMQPNLQERI